MHSTWWQRWDSNPCPRREGEDVSWTLVCLSYLFMSCPLVPCYVRLCYVVLRYVTLRYVMLRYVTLCYVTLCYAMLRYVMLCYVMLHHIPFLLVVNGHWSHCLVLNIQPVIRVINNNHGECSLAMLILHNGR